MRIVTVIAEAQASVKVISTRDPLDYSMVMGGPLYQLYRRMRLSGEKLELLPRRMLAIALLAWLPLMLLSLLESGGLRGAVRIPFLYDIEAHVRFLIALPMLIGAEVFVHTRISPLARKFVERRIVRLEELPKFKAAVNSALRARNSIALEVTLLLLVYTVGLWIWRSRIALEAASWYARPDAAHLHLTAAGYWCAFVSIPIFQFILLRWYLRLGIWFRFLWQVSRLNLRLTAANPDRAGGIGFLGSNSYAFAPIIFAQGSLLAGLIASRIFHEGRSLMSFKMEAIGFMVFFVLVILGPLLMFMPQLEHAKRKSAAEYGLLVSRYQFLFEEKWMHGNAADTKALLGSADIQALAALGDAHTLVDQMHIIPFGAREITQLAVATAVPLLPLAFTMFSADELLGQLLKIFF